MKSGDTFLYPLDFANSGHLWVVLTNPNPDGIILVVNVTTVYSNDKNIDATVRLNTGDHPFIDRQSYIYYRGAMMIEVSELQTAERAGRLKMHDGCSEKLLSIVRSGIGASKHCSRVIKRFFNDHKDR